MQFLEQTFYENSISTWFLALAITVFCLLIGAIIKRLIIGKLNRFSQKTLITWNDLIIEVLKKTKIIFLIIISLYFGTLILKLSPRMQHFSHNIGIITLMVQCALWGTALIVFLLNRLVKKKMTDDTSSIPMIVFTGFIAKLILWTLVVLLALDNLGVNISALVAGLGVGGIAVALASQKILEDLFSSLSIILDKPFVTGDFIIVDDYLGVVEHIGLKTTRVRSLSGEQLVFSNSDLLTSRIRNFKKMFERRVVLNMGVTYQTQREKLEKIPKIIKETIEAQEVVRFDRAHFYKFTDSSLSFEAVYYVKSPDYNLYMDIQQAINLTLVERFAEEKIDFAYPTQTVFLQKFASYE